MLDDHAKVLTVLQHAGVVSGRKKLQKMLFILKKLNYPFREKFAFHFFGPYSEELTLQIEELCNLGFVEEIKEKQGGFHQYRYQLSDSGEHFLTHFEFQLPELDDLVSFLNNQSARFLELVATAFYFDHMDESEIREKISVVKANQRFTEEELDQAFLLIKELKQNQQVESMVH